MERGSSLERLAGDRRVPRLLLDQHLVNSRSNKSKATGGLAMLKYFKDEATRPARALQMWQILIGKAHNRQTITYGQLAELLGFHGAGTLAHMLGHLYYYCPQNSLPPLTVLVVNQDTGLPGEGFADADLHRSREQVFGYDWYGVWPPTVEALDAAYKKGHVSAAGST
jgi:hypothetical protein